MIFRFLGTNILHAISINALHWRTFICQSIVFKTLPVIILTLFTGVGAYLVAANVYAGHYASIVWIIEG